MNLIEIGRKYGTHLKCVQHLEKVRWDGTPVCPHCSSNSITSRARKTNRGRKMIHPESAYKTPRYHCNNCNKDFTVLNGTIFEGSKLHLEKWFALIGLMVNAKKGISAKQISRDIDVTYKTAWFAMMRVRCAMVGEENMLEGIIEQDEVYLGGRLKHKNFKENEAVLSQLNTNEVKGRKSTKVVGIVQRGGGIRLKAFEKLSGTSMLAMLKKYVKTDRTVAMTDESTLYHKYADELQHLTVTHSKKEYARGIVHTNTIEGAFSLIRKMIHQHHALSKKYLPFYLAEFQYKYNRRNEKVKNLTFNQAIERAVTDKKCVVRYKPKGDVKRIVYGKKRRKKIAA